MTRLLSRNWRRAIAAVVLATAPAEAHAWTRPAHMVTAAIAYDQLASRRPDLLDKIGALLDAHPDRAPFEVAIDRKEGVERRRRMFLECARWPDDARRTPFDHPTWHFALRDVRAHDASPALQTTDVLGELREAFALNIQVLSDAVAEPAEKAVALCWVLHLTGDIHQPLHTAQLVTEAFPEGDRGGASRFVLDPLTGAAISLHWLWDDAVHRSGAVGDVDEKASELERQFPRAALTELSAPAHARDFSRWAADESYPLAVRLAFSREITPALNREGATAIPPPYWRTLSEAAARRVTVAGYRIADLLIAALDKPAAR